MRTRQTRISAALLLVLMSLLLASLACYSGQIPGVLELTPYYTPTPMGDPVDARFGVLEMVLAPQEAGRTFFNLTVDPEPLEPSLVNSKSMCQGNSSAMVLYYGLDHHDEIYYLIDCIGSVGWVSEHRLAGPLSFEVEDLALTVVPEGGMDQSVEMLDDGFRPLPFNPLQTCKPETVVRITDVVAADPDNDSEKDIFYQIDCPTTGGPLKGWVTDDNLFGPVPINVEQRALAFAPEGREFQLASEPAPPSADNVVEGECAEGDILVAQEVQLGDHTTYYKMKCGEVEGWITTDMFVGPLQFNTGDNVVVFVQTMPVFADTLEVQPGDEEGDVQIDDDAIVEPVEDEDVVVEDTHERSSAQGREVLQITPPLYLTSDPAPADPLGDDSNVVAECSSGMVAQINDYAAADTIYYYVDCNECEVDEDGELNCEVRTGWAVQELLQGPVDFVIGQRVAFTERSNAIETDDDGTVWARIPPNLESAGTMGAYTRYTGRCVREDGLEIMGVQLEKDRTRNRFSFYFEVQCTGQSSTITEERDGNIVRPKVEYNDDETLVTGFASSRDLEAVEE